MGFDADGRGDPDDGNESDQAKRYARVLEGERDRDEVDKEGEPVFSFDGFVFCFKSARMAQTASDGQTQKEKAEAGNDHGRDVNGNRERIQLLFEDIGGKERKKRETEEEAQVGVEDKVVGLLGAMDEMVVVNPIDPDKAEGDEIEAERGENGVEAGEAVLVGNLELKHHDGDDDGDDSVGEGFEASWRGDVTRHRCRAGLESALAEAYNGDCRGESCPGELESRHGYNADGIGRVFGRDEDRSCGVLA